MPRKKPEAESKITLPITPMLDMTFQLLFFFIINFHPADIEGQIGLELPAEGERKAVVPKPVKPLLPAFPADMTVKLRTQGGPEGPGRISAIFPQTAEGKEEPVNGPEGLKRSLVEKRTGLKHLETINVQGEGRLQVKWVMQVMDVCRKAGFEKISFIPPEDSGK